MTPQRFNVPTPTAGGTQLWTDHRNRHGVRVQAHAVTGHWRVLDRWGIRRGWGTKGACLARLDELAPDPPATPQPHAAATPHDASPHRQVIVLLHGLMRTHHSMTSMVKRLHGAGMIDTIAWEYASTRTSLAQQAAALRELIEDLPADATLRFVAHSMGNIVVRHLIADVSADGDRAGLLPRMRAMVMLGPPNNGALIAKRLSRVGGYGWITGRGGIELGPGFDTLRERLAVPPFPFAIVAGDLSAGAIRNPLTDGAGDFVVSVDEARLEGAAALKVIPRMHSFLMDDVEAQDFTIDFLSQRG